MNTKISGLSLVSLFLVFSLNVGMGFLSPALNSIFKAFPDASQTTLYFITTLPSITLMISALVTGFIVGKKVSYRTMVVIGSLLFILGGVTPTFFHSNLEVILIFRAIYGLGMGVLIQLGNTLVTELFEGNKRATYIGYGQLFADVAGVIVLVVCGILASLNWKYSFLCFFVGIIPLIFAPFLPDPTIKSHTKMLDKEDKEVEKAKNIGSIWRIAIFFLITSMVIIPIQFNISLYFADKHVGGAALSGIAVSVYTLAGAIGGMVFGQCMKRMKKPLTIFFLTGALGAILLLYGKDTFTLMLGSALCGFMFSTSIAYGYTLVGTKVTSSTAAMSFNILQVCFNIGVFLCSYFLGFVAKVFGNILYPHLIICIGFFVILAVLFLFFDPMSARKTPSVISDVPEDISHTTY